MVQSQIGYKNFQVFTKSSTIMDMKDKVSTPGFWVNSQFLNGIWLKSWQNWLFLYSKYIDPVQILELLVVHNREIPCLKLLSKNKLIYVQYSKCDPLNCICLQALFSYSIIHFWQIMLTTFIAIFSHNFCEYCMELF